MKKIVIFASGSGSNAEKIIVHLLKKSQNQVVGIFTNNANAQVIERTKKYTIPTIIFSKLELESDYIIDILKEIKPDLIVLAGFLIKFPTHIINQFPNKIINIHPALLPNYGGKGMYGINVHKAVLDNNDKETGITIHYVTENYDEGEFIFQKSVNIEDCKTAQEIAEKILLLEHQFFPEVIEKLISN